jgi:hypothetical protein
MPLGGHDDTQETADWAYTRLASEAPLYRDEFSIYLVQVDSETDAGRELLVDPIDFFRRNIPEMGLGEETDVRAMVLRVNAEISANPKHRSEVWLTIPGSTNAIGLQYKYDRDMVNPEQS